MLYQRLIYRSRAEDAEDLGRNLSQILHASRHHNRAHGITGVLTCFDDHFIQIIEGPPAQIDRLMAVLARDPRHHDIEVLGRWAASHRLFGGWAMASPPTSEISVTVRQNLLSGTCGLQMVTELFSLVSSSPVLF